MEWQAASGQLTVFAGMLPGWVSRRWWRWLLFAAPGADCQTFYLACLVLFVLYELMQRYYSTLSGQGPGPRGPHPL